MKGFIKLHRQIEEHWLFEENREFSKFEAWIFILWKSNHKDKTFLLGDELIEVNRGSFVTSKEKLQNKFKWGRKKLDTFFKLLKQEQMLDTQGIGKGTHKGTQLFVLNYSKYQDKEHTKEHSTDTERNTKEYSRGTTTKECIKNVKKKEIYSDDKSSEINSNTKRFKEPTEDEVSDYFIANGRREESDKFYNFYASKGWIVGKTKMKDWTRAASGWISRSGGKFKNVTPTEWRNLIKENKVKHKEVFDFYIERKTKEPYKRTMAILNNNERLKEASKYSEGAEKEDNVRVEQMLEQLNN